MMVVNNKQAKPIVFPRGDGPLVSVLMPTRRSHLLWNSIDSLFRLAKDWSLIEVILKVDSDDFKSIILGIQLAEIFPLRMIVSARGRGYKDFHLWVNTMCLQARGDWLFIFNDDCFLETYNWDQKLLHASVIDGTWHGVKDVCGLVTYDIRDPPSTGFVFVRKKVFDLIGYYSLIPHCDTWITNILRRVSSLHRFDEVRLSHRIGDGFDSTYIEGNPARTPQYASISNQLEITQQQDADTLKKYIKHYQSSQ